MFAKLHDQFGSAGLVLSIVAIVLALGGGAYAANHATASKAKAGPRGKPGKNGTNGTNGTNGAPGATGPAGPAGAPGTSVTAAEFEEEAGPCTEGGSEFKAANATTYACNGAQGKQGKEGSPWTLGGTLPKGATEKGNWAFGGMPSNSFEFGGQWGETSISFVIPLKEPEAFAVHVIQPGFPAANKSACEAKPEPEQKECLETLAEEEENCPGSAVNPQAKTGNVCVFIAEPVNGIPPLKNVFELEPGVLFVHTLAATGFETVETSGVMLFAAAKVKEKGINISGTWAVTGQ